ncbi:MAG: bifunctional (p)ppGpp synthetase/guanosine-3',5'-bis(diphosphate) 3'-pyrophosphohydrolase [Syntrophobacterales bacterium]|jgi:GTP pyrophosphokinase|nr:bifunctional (p)ppGpp synthetase/guanosine-3',5'-bis(diphosphate) 3'-pyrophosphohydrolase [Syntrophobacterales bacterium]
MLRITDILDKAESYLPPQDLEGIEKAYIYSAGMHHGQVRLSGEPYLSHPMEVAGILADMELDAATIITGFLHDAVEDTLATLKDIEAGFGHDVAFLVDGLTKMSKIQFASKEERQAETFRKMILAMSADIRILLVKLADRVHNMRTLEYQNPDKQRKIAQETLDIFAPLANRLGINWIKMELEDLAFRYLQPNEYDNLSKLVAKGREERKEYTQEVRKIIIEEINKCGLKGEVDGRPKHFFSIYRKMQAQQIDFDKVYDLTAFRIILDSHRDQDCYQALSVVHSCWKPIPGRFKDYIALPKMNNYRSLHTTVIGPHGERVEIQIRTREMHEWAEEGIAAHWRYKEKRPQYEARDEEQIKKLRELLEVQKDLTNPREFMSNLKLALYHDEVYVFTPNGDVLAFPRGSTPIDFAYSIHTDLGNQCVGAKVNRSIVPLKYELQNGDTVEIITQAGRHPSKDWLKIAKTSRALQKIKHWITMEERTRSIDLGRDMLEKEFRKRGIKYGSFVKSDELKSVFADFSLNSLDDLLAMVGCGKLSPRKVSNYVIADLEEEKKEESPADIPVRDKKKSKSSAGISLTGIDNIMVRFSKCCDPVPGDEILGFVSRGRGISVHKADCPNVQGAETDRLVELEWNIKEKHTYPVHLRVVCRDQKGSLAEISGVITSFDVNITQLRMDAIDGLNVMLDFRVDVHDLQQFNKMVTGIKRLKNVQSVERMKHV